MYKTISLAKVLKLRSMDHFNNKTEADASFSDNTSLQKKTFFLR